MMASPPPLPHPPEPRGQGREGGEGVGCWVVVGRVSLQASGHTLYWMPRKRHMAKIMAKSCRESGCRLVRLGPQPSTRRPLCGKRYVCPRAGRGVRVLLLPWALPTPPGGKPFSPATGPFSSPRERGFGNQETWLQI